MKKRERNKARDMRKQLMDGEGEQTPTTVVDKAMGIPWCSGVLCPFYDHDKAQCKLTCGMYRTNADPVKADVVCLPVVQQLVQFYHAVGANQPAEDAVLIKEPTDTDDEVN